MILGLQNENLVLKAKDMGLDTLKSWRSRSVVKSFVNTFEIPASQEVCLRDRSQDTELIRVPEMPGKEECRGYSKILLKLNFEINFSKQVCGYYNQFFRLGIAGRTLNPFFSSDFNGSAVFFFYFQTKDCLRIHVSNKFKKLASDASTPESFFDINVFQPDTGTGQIP